MVAVLFIAASLSQVAIRERVPDWEVMVEDEPLWSSSGKRGSTWAFSSIGRKKGVTDLISGKGRQQMMLMLGSLQVSQNDGCQRKAAADAQFQGTILVAGGCAGCWPFGVQ